MGIDKLTALVVNVAKVVSVAIKSLRSGNVFSIVGGLVGIIGPALALKDTDFNGVLQELKDLDASERGQIESAFLANLDVGDVALQEKIAGILGLVDESVALVASAVQVANSAVDVVKRVRLLLGA